MQKKKADSKQNSVRKRIFEIIQIGNTSDTPSKAFDFFIVAVIELNIAVMFTMTFDLKETVRDILHTIEFVTIIIFLIEYALRIWTADFLYPENGVITSRLRFMITFSGIVDLLTILPYFLPFFFPSGAVVFRMFRVVRILHLFRINSKYDAFNVITEVLKEKKNQLISSVFLIVILMIASSLCMYDLEHEVQPEQFSNAFSGIWWSVSTLLTVGYGDIYPITVGGKMMAIVIAFLGVGVVAIPTGIVSAGFYEYYTRIKTGIYSERNVDFVVLEIGKKHPYVGKEMEELEIPNGLYVAVVIRGDDVNTPYSKMVVEEGDRLLLGAIGSSGMEGKLDEVVLEKEHPWIGYAIKELDISRQTFIVMVKRSGNKLRPQPDMILKEKDQVFMLEKKRVKHGT